MITDYDVFVSYNWKDRQSVESVARALRDRGLSVFLDRWYLAPGRPWPRALEDILSSSAAVAVFIGAYGMGGWQQREKDLALDRQSRDESFPVVPILLPGADPALGFLALNTWVDLRGGIEDPDQLSLLTSAIKGQAPGPQAQAKMGATLSAVCPYRGLRPFREEDASFFFGREAAVSSALEAADRSSLLALIGSSGSGKSSVALAGVVPRLRAQTQGVMWEVAIFRPGDRPLRALASTLIPLLEPETREVDQLVETSKLASYLADGTVHLRDVAERILQKQPGTDRLMLVADQWEELYTLGDPKEATKFIDAVLEATSSSQVAVLITLRGDFYGHALSHRGLSDRLQHAIINIGPMTREEIERVVEKPADRLGLAFERGLVGRILDAVGSEPGNLPLLEFTLTKLWEERHQGVLNHQAYETVGELYGSIASQAESVIARLDRDAEALAKRIFTGLVRLGEGTDDTRRRTPLSELPEQATEVVRTFIEARLLVAGLETGTGEPSIEVAHEALIRHWARLRHWIDEDREFLLW